MIQNSQRDRSRWRCILGIKIPLACKTVSISGHLHFLLPPQMHSTVRWNYGRENLSRFSHLALRMRLNKLHRRHRLLLPCYKHLPIICSRYFSLYSSPDSIRHLQYELIKIQCCQTTCDGSSVRQGGQTRNEDSQTMFGALFFSFESVYMK